MEYRVVIKDDLFVIVKCLKEPVGCHLWHKEKLTRKDLDCLERVKVIVDSSHLMREIKRCKECGQLYYYDFSEVSYMVDPDAVSYTHLTLPTN